MYAKQFREITGKQMKRHGFINEIVEKKLTGAYEVT